MSGSFGSVMSNKHSRYRGFITRQCVLWLSTAAKLAVAAGLALPMAAQQQPIDYPHDKHIAMGLECIDCHSRADARAEATLPSIHKCLLCHEKLAKEGAGVARLLEFAKQGREVPWQRVYGFEKSASVKFRHAPHVRGGIQCATCHGNVAEMTTARKAVNHTMGTCLKCHRQNQASEDCLACHF